MVVVTVVMGEWERWKRDARGRKERKKMKEAVGRK